MDKHKTLSLNKSKRNINDKSKNAHERLLKDRIGGVISIDLLDGESITGKLLDADRYALIIQPSDGSHTQDPKRPEGVTIFKHAIKKYY